MNIEPSSKSSFKVTFINISENNISTSEVKYRKIRLVNCKEETEFKKDGLPTDSGQFCIGILQCPAFKELFTFALTCLIIAVSNAVVKNKFSLVNTLETKARK